ncbi:sterol desaturase family protein [Brumimicrobium aurantiacum]|uniref:Fatty acid hydroxylase n=1 Tax=Brumimicrobium aurantiacum TaxID=1737063 RepID=A0A3E1EUC1_9FLAO|nr:sterol desaturase family protein [Brumimicrobium aurantiacum]RFC53128.1 fatty acid hydroxylase [Brumimicrobium aurantiacum]
MKFRVYPNEKSPKLFKSKMVEYLTRTNIYVINSMYILISIMLISTYFYNVNPSILAIFKWFAIGFLSWTLAEYLMHRFLYHKIKDASYDKGIQYLFHGIHHRYPTDNDRMILPVIPSLFIAALFLGLFYLIFQSEALVFGAGFLIGYLVYMTIHWTIHKFSPPKNKFLSWWWNHHNIHHYQQHDKAFGVSTPIWDIIFRTMPEKNRRTVTILVDKKED